MSSNNSLKFEDADLNNSILRKSTLHMNHDSSRSRSQRKKSSNSRKSRGSNTSKLSRSVYSKKSRFSQKNPKKLSSRNKSGKSISKHKLGGKKKSIFRDKSANFSKNKSSNDGPGFGLFLPKKEKSDKESSDNSINNVLEDDLELNIFKNSKTEPIENILKLDLRTSQTPDINLTRKNQENMFRMTNSSRNVLPDQVSIFKQQEMASNSRRNSLDSPSNQMNSNSSVLRKLEPKNDVKDILVKTKSPEPMLFTLNINDELNRKNRNIMSFGGSQIEENSVERKNTKLSKKFVDKFKQI